MKKPEFIRIIDGISCITITEHEHLIESYITKQDWVGLTDAELESAYWDYIEIGTQNGFKKVIKILENKLKNENTNRLG